MFKGIRNAFSSAVNSVKSGVSSFFAPLTDAIDDIRTKLTDNDREDISEAIDNPDRDYGAVQASEVLDEAADDADDYEDAIALEEAAESVTDGTVQASDIGNILEDEYNEPEDFEQLTDDIEDRARAIWEEYEVEEWEPLPNDAAVDPDARYHMEIEYTCVLNDGRVFERSIDRYNFMSEDIIKGMVWDNIFSEGDGEGGDIKTDMVASVTHSVASYW